MKSALKKSVVAVALLAGAGAANAEFSANVAMTTDYVWRGTSQADGGPAIQGGIDYNHESGFYVGTWASNVDWDEVGVTDPVSVEWDVYGGFGTDLTDKLSFDIGIVRYMYPNTSYDADWTELYGSLTYAFTDTVSLTGSVAHSTDVFALGDDGTYVNAELSIGLPQDFGLTAAIGHYSFANTTGLNDYTDWKLALSKSYGGFDFELAYTDTDDDTFFVSGIDGESYSDGRVAFSVSKSF